MYKIYAVGKYKFRRGKLVYAVSFYCGVLINSIGGLHNTIPGTLIASEVMYALKKPHVEYVVAPCEADVQMTYLEQIMFL